jgi:signal transduction histidine kinase
MQLKSAGEFEESQRWYEKGLALTEGAEYWSDAATFCRRLSSLHEAQSRYDLALEYKKEQNSFTGKFRDQRRDAVVQLLRTDNQIANKEKLISQQKEENLSLENSNLKQSQQIIGISLAAALAVFVLAAIGVAQRRKRKRQELETMEREREAEQQVSDLIQNHRFEKLTATIQGEEQERDRLAKEIHDGVGGTLSGIAMKLEATDDKDELKSLADRLRKTHDELRNISHNIALPALEDNTLVELTGNLLANVKSDHGLEVGYVHFPTDKPFGLDQRLEIASYRIIQELVNNTVKHARASKLEVQLTRHEDGLLIVIEDDGVGFDQGDFKAGLGLKNVRERAAVFNGVVKLDTKPGRGTFVSVDIPVV